MYDVLFTFRSMTAAQQGQHACKRHGIRANLVRIPYKISQRGCGFAVQIPPNMFDQVLLIFKVDKIDFERIYQRHDDQTQEVLL